LLGWLFVVTVLGGLLGLVAGRFEFTSPVEVLLPSGIRDKGFGPSRGDPAAAQIMDIVGADRPRPAAPWGYTNTWGNNFCLLAGWLVVAAWSSRRLSPKLLALLGLAGSVVPAVVSLNRGLWIGLGLLVVYVAFRYVLLGKVWILGLLALATAGLVVALFASPLGDVVSARLDNGKSNGV